MCAYVCIHMYVQGCVYIISKFHFFSLFQTMLHLTLFTALLCIHVIFLKAEYLPNCVGYMHCKYFSQTVNFLLILWDNFVLFFGNLSALMSQTCFHIYSYKFCNVLLFIYRHLTHLELIFEYGVKQVSNSILLHMENQLSQCHLQEKCVLFLLMHSTSAKITFKIFRGVFMPHCHEFLSVFY